MRQLLTILGLGVAAAVGLCIVCVLALGVLAWVLYSHDRPVLVDHLVQLAKPEVIDRLEVTDKSHKVLWALESHGSVKVKTLDYGDVPDGYVQVVPVQGSPRPLERGVWVSLFISMSNERSIQAWSQVARGKKFYRGLVITGSGCVAPLCDDKSGHWGPASTNNDLAVGKQGP